MKNTYYLSIDVVSNKKTTSEEIDAILNSIELLCEASDVLGCILENISLNFQDYAVISIESQEFQNDLSDRIDQIINFIESEFPGGCTIDSRIEWGSDADDYSTLWFRGKESWEVSQIENELKIYGDSEWEDDEDLEDERETYW
jgi:hypothetical protein